MSFTSIPTDDRVLHKFILAKLDEQAKIGKQLSHSEFLEILLEERDTRRKR